MAVDYKKSSGLANNRYLQRRVLACLVETALDVMAEDGGTANHAERATYADKVLKGERVADDQVMLAVTTNSTILTGVTEPILSSESASEDISDGDLEFQMSAIWDALSGVS